MDWSNRITRKSFIIKSERLNSLAYNDSVIVSSLDPNNHKENRKKIDIDSVFFPDNHESLKSLTNGELGVAVNDNVDSKKNSMLVILDKKLSTRKEKSSWTRGLLSSRPM